MALLKKDATKKPSLARMSGGGKAGEVSSLRPQAVEKTPGCIGHCPSGNDIRGWLTVIAQREKLGLTLEEACDKAWYIEVETNPFPCVMGRVCPHPCEGECNRKAKDGAVAINSVERFIGDWGLERGLKLPSLDAGGPFEEKIAVVGAGPAGLSCAYQLARRGYKVTVFEALGKPGGMLRYGIPQYRLPRGIMDAEIKRILDLGVELKCNSKVGADISVEELRQKYQAIFVGIGAHKGRTMGIPGEDGPGVYTGTEFLNKASAGQPVEVGKKVVVVGGGDTAVDAARVSLRWASNGAARPDREVTILYRRTRTEMPAIDREIEEALEENIKIDLLAAPIKVLRDESGALNKLLVQRMELGEPDESGRRRPVPKEGDVYEMEADTLILAVSQQPDVAPLTGIKTKGSWLEADKWGCTETEGIWSGGDALNIGIATTAIGNGRAAAESIHARLRGQEPQAPYAKPHIGPDRIKLDWYQAKPAAKREITPAEERLAKPTEEMDHGITREQALEEVTRCFSCGLCFGCENCWMYCQVNCFKKVENPAGGNYYEIKLPLCDGCRKCAEECPCGFLEMV
jgi:NADPH-dependent glutamate synthase beta subunit-like oxidoreductase/Pyruvate/2-oxoacid:ferredoxin oxidoreductase delta subunit